MDLVDIEYFVVLGEELHFGRAGERLFSSTSYVSQRIRRLERDLGIQLFKRSTRQVSLTSTGADLLPRARHLLAEAKEFRLAAGRPPEPTPLTITYGPSLGSFAARVVKDFPASPFRPRLVPSATSIGVITSVAEGQSDLGITQWVNPTVGHLSIGSINWVLLVPVAHPLASAASASISDLNDERLLLFDHELNPGMDDLLTRFFAARSVYPRYERRVFASSEQYVDLVETGQGIALVTLPNPEFLEHRLVRAIPFTGDRPPVNQVHLVWRLGQDDEWIDELRSALLPDNSFPLDTN